MYLHYLQTDHLAQDEALRRQFYQQLPNSPPPHIILDTCDRLELYSVQRCCLPFLTGPDWQQNEGPQSLRHLYRVVSGLDSPLFGEKAIQGQVKEAYGAACAAGKMPKDLHQSFQSALRVGKRVRRETGLDLGAMSHVRAIWEILQQNLDDQQMAQLAICFLGVNQLNADLAELFHGKGLRKFFLGNRSFAKATEACRKWGGAAFRLEHMSEIVQCCQVIISTTRAPHFVLHPAQVQERQTPLYIFDLAMPRDVDPLVAQISGVHLWNVADIEKQIAGNSRRRRLKEPLAEKIIAAELEKFYA